MANGLSLTRAPVFHNNNSTASSITSQSLEYGGNIGNVSNFSSSLNFSRESLNDEEKDNPWWSFEFSVIMATILSISAFLTIVGNVMVLTVIYRHRGMRTRTNLFLVNLAIADFLVGIMVVPISIATLVEGRWRFGVEMCNLNGWVNGMCLITSIHTLMYMGINKYFSICRPLSNPIQLRHIILMLGASWFWGAFCATLTVTGLNTVVYKNGTSQCGPDYPREAKGYMFHGIVQFTVIVIPFCILLFCYIRIYRAIKSHSARLRINTTVEEYYILNQQKKVAVTLFIVLATFIIMALPYHCYATYTTIRDDKQNFSSYINPIAYLFLYLNSMCNPIIYAFRSPAFREGYKEILCQTPNYVIRDDYSYEHRSQRTSSNVSSGRGRTVLSNPPSVSNTDSSNDSADPRSPAPLLSSPVLGEPRRSVNGKQPKPAKLKKQPTMTELIRKSRRTSAPVAIRRDGDFILVKAGKIVSVRRESDSSYSSAALSPTKRLADVREVPYGNSVAQMVFSQLTIDSAVREESNENGGKNGDDSVYNDSASKYKPNGFCDLNNIELKQVSEESPKDLDDNVQDEEEHNSADFLTPIGSDGLKSSDSKDFSYHSIEELSSSPRTETEKNSNRERLNDRRNAPHLTVQIHPPVEKTTSSSPPNPHANSQTYNKNDNPKSLSSSLLLSSTSSALPGLSNMAAGIAATTKDILLGMPLTPFTRNMLTKSDQQLNTAKDAAESSSSASQALLVRHRQQPAVSTISHAHSIDHLDQHRPRFMRCPSLEYLDRPRPLFSFAKSHSKNNKPADV